MEYRDVFLRITCPICGRETDPSDLKYTDYSDNGPGYYECYRCECGASFSVEVLVDKGATRDIHANSPQHLAHPPRHAQKRIALRNELGDRTFKTAVRLLDMNAIVEKVRLSNSAYYARVKDDD